LGGELFLFPYDGGSIGEPKGDAIRNLSGSFITRDGCGAFHSVTQGIFKATGLTSSYTFAAQQSGSAMQTIEIDLAAAKIPTDKDNHPAQMAVALYIQY
jgi:hypothetical protein